MGVGADVDCPVGMLVTLEPGVAAARDPPLGVAVGASAPSDDVGTGTVVAVEVGVGAVAGVVAVGSALGDGWASPRRGDGVGRGRGPAEPAGPAGPSGVTV